MPTLFRLLVLVGLVAGLAYAGMWAMVTFLHPAPHEIVHTIQLPPAR